MGLLKCLITHMARVTFPLDSTASGTATASGHNGDRRLAYPTRPPTRVLLEQRPGPVPQSSFPRAASLRDSTRAAPALLLALLPSHRGRGIRARAWPSQPNPRATRVRPSLLRRPRPLTETQSLWRPVIGPSLLSHKGLLQAPLRVSAAVRGNPVRPLCSSESSLWGETPAPLEALPLQ